MARVKGWRPADHGANPGGRPGKGEGGRRGERAVIKVDLRTVAAITAMVAAGSHRHRSPAVLALLEAGARLREAHPELAVNLATLPWGRRYRDAVALEEVILTADLSAVVAALRVECEARGVPEGMARAVALRALLADGVLALAGPANRE